MPAISFIIANVVAAHGLPDIRMTAVAVGDAPLCGQAVRVRLSATNGSHAPASNLWAIDSGMVVVTEARPPADRPVAGHRIPLLRDLYPVNRGVAVCGGGGPNTGPVTLPPGGRQSVTVAVGVTPAGDKEFPVRPLFPEPGEYALRFRYTYAHQSPPDPPPNAPVSAIPLFAEAEVVVTVGRPGPGDQPWVDALADRDLATVLMTPHAPCSAAQAAAIRKLLAKAPESSYADYGRLAVARFHTDGRGDPALSWRLNRATAADLLEEYDRQGSGGFPFRPHVLQRLSELDVVCHRQLTNSTSRRNWPGDAVEWADYFRPRLSAEQWADFRRPTD